MSDEAIQQWRHENKACKVERPFVSSDRAIETILTLRELFHLTYRTVEGFVCRLVRLMKIETAFSDSTANCRDKRRSKS
ncbi:MAG: transposase [Planctomycetaceae bacterium]|nr:transposase [Planctomycetaceae bacterium]